MAMVSCRECKHSVSDSAPTCPSCGVKSPGGHAQLEIKRAKSMLGAALPLSVWVDSNYVGDLGPDNNVTLTVTPGPHRVQCQLANHKAASQQFEVPAGRHLLVTVATSRWTGEPKFAPELV
ncbi:zinc ribbon domain-containing protein [Longispora sp. K20-0274]|uniref:zinc ribbon domain-containing protein n=1 Tax=Longispora sp. K20-0274 TaxID=3088255 RepID=UPI00399ACAA8